MIGKTNGNLYAKDGGIEYEQLINYTMLYDRDLNNATANQCIDITGGFSGCACTESGYSNYSTAAPTVNKTATYLQATRGASNYLGAMLTINSINITDYTKYNVYGYFYSSGNQYPWQQPVIMTGRSGYVTSLKNGTRIQNATKTGWLNTDLSTVTGNGYIGMEFYYYGITTTCNIYYAVLFKSDDYITLAEHANITATSIADILTNSEILLNNKDAVNFMLKQCTGDFMAAAIQNSTFLTALENSPYKTIIQANEHWNKFLNMAV